MNIIQSELMEQIKQFLNESKQELKKVVWPPRKHAIASTSVVLVVVFIIAFLLGLMDTILAKLISTFLT